MFRTMVVSLQVDGVRVEADDITADTYRFTVTLPAQEIRLQSGAARPAELSGSKDSRLLGVMLTDMQWSQSDATAAVPVTAPQFLDGCYPVQMLEGGPARWTTGNAGLPLDAVRDWRGPTVLTLRLQTWAGSKQPIPDDNASKVVGAFESLGDTCEFGGIQRHFGVEPALTLFRWSGTTLEQLITGLNTGFAGLGDADQTEIVWSGSEYYLRTPFLYLHTNCRVERDAAGVEEIAAGGRAMLRLLRRKLLWDIAQAKRIFVFTAAHSVLTEINMRRLHTAVRSIGPASLLCIRRAAEGEVPGGVEQLSDGLYRGLISEIGKPDKPVDEWFRICSTALAYHQQET